MSTTQTGAATAVALRDVHKVYGSPSMSVSALAGVSLAFARAVAAWPDSCPSSFRAVGDRANEAQTQVNIARVLEQQQARTGPVRRDR